MSELPRIEFPVYIPTKGRPSRQLTANALLKLGIRPRLVVEDAEHDAYAADNPDCDVLVWPQRYMDEYEKTPELDPHPTTGAAHNFAWDHSRDEGFTHHWVMDDNIRGLEVRQRKQRFTAADQRPMVWHETFIQRWKNLAGICIIQSGFMRAAAPIELNTRLYCATLYRNDLNQYGIKWRRGLNDDTIVSLDILKTGYWCTAQSTVVGIRKISTSRATRIEGGMTDFYSDGGFIKKSSELVRIHPDCCHTAIRFKRIHHVCDYRRFKQKLIRADG